MYGTIARMKVKPGKEAELMSQGQHTDAVRIPGHIGEIIYRTDADPNVNFLVMLFESKEAYVANANSPEQNERYEQMVSLLDGAPEWHDGTIVHSYPKLG